MEECLHVRPPGRTLLILCLWLSGVAVAQSSPISSAAARRATINRALEFIYKTASDEAVLARYGHDMLWCFYSISHTARDSQLRESARRMGQELALRWLRTHRHVPADATATDIYHFVEGSYAADRLGLSAPRFKTELRRAAQRFTAKEYLGFDALHEPPPPENPDRYDLWSGALITTFFGDAYGIQLGAHYRDVIKWLPRMRPYDGHDESMDTDIFYAITHVIYTLNGYHERRISASLLPQEISFLRRQLDQAMEDDDPEMVGEALDCLKAAGFKNDPQVAKGTDYLISTQRDDGTWVGDKDDVYTEYHSAWTGIDGLRNYRFHGRIRKLPL